MDRSKLEKLAKLVALAPDFLLVYRTTETETAGGIVLTESKKTERGDAAKAEVISVGPGKPYVFDNAVHYEDLRIGGEPVGVGDTLFISSLAGVKIADTARRELDLDQKEADCVLLIRQHDVMGKLVKG